jgi:hypothetical protein
LIVIDNICLLPVGEDAAEAFYRIIDAACERRSIAVTSNIHPIGFGTIMPKTLAGTSTDRLTHHAHLVTTTGDSHRLAEALAGKGVVPVLTPTPRNTTGHTPGLLMATHLGISMAVDNPEYNGQWPGVRKWVAPRIRVVEIAAQFERATWMIQTRNATPVLELKHRPARRAARLLQSASHAPLPAQSPRKPGRRQGQGNGPGS